MGHKMGGRPCILVVEDDDAIRETLGLVLQAEGFEVHSASDGAEAISHLYKAKVMPELVITDLMMPNISGWELIDVLRALDRTSSIPIVVLSAVTKYTSTDRVLSGCLFVEKPFDLDALLGVINKALHASDDAKEERANDDTQMDFGF